MKSRDGKSQRREKKRREAFIGEHHFSVGWIVVVTFSVFLIVLGACFLHLLMFDPAYSPCLTVAAYSDCFVLDVLSIGL
jgi:hypothetical protein